VVPGVRFVPIECAGPAFESAVLTLPGPGDELGTTRFLRAVAHATRIGPAAVSSVRLAA
jgi:hypothetical protein